MNRIAEFARVSETVYAKSFLELFPSSDAAKIRSSYLSISLPVRATEGSAGYDFRSTVDFTLRPGEEITIPSGIRARIEPGWVLMLFPRSGLGFKYRLQLDNTVGIIDSDYYFADNEGHILMRVINDSRNGKTLTVREGDSVIQGIFLPFGITATDDAKERRSGGFGSTGR